MPPGGIHVHPVPQVSTILTQAERAKVEAAGEGLYTTLHRASMDDVLRDVREQRAGAIVMSIACCVDGQLERLATLVREFPRVPAVAVLSESGPVSAQHVLSLGQSGVRTLIDLRRPQGWTELRSLLMSTRSRGISRSALAQLTLDMRGAHNSCISFFELIFNPDNEVRTVRGIAHALGVHTGTMMSRFYRAGLPAPKRYLAFARLVRAAELFENPGLSIANVANHLDYSSPQSFGRHVRMLLNMSAVELRRQYDGEGMLQRFREELVLPYLTVLRRFRPVGGSSRSRVPVVR